MTDSITVTTLSSAAAHYASVGTDEAQPKPFEPLLGLVRWAFWWVTGT